MVARTDLVADPAVRAALLLARRGQAFWARQLSQITDAGFDAPTLLPDWDRRHLVAHVGLNARALTRLIEWAATGVETPMYASMAERNTEIEFGATLPPRALRTLNDHAAIHLTVEWRDLPDAAWSNEVRTAQGRLVPVSETVWMRTREVWLHAVDLDNGARFTEIPTTILDRLLTEVLGAWDSRRATEGLPSFVLEPTDGRASYRSAPAPAVSDTPARAHADTPVVVRGTLAALAQWATGRGGTGVVTPSGDAPPLPPRWL